MGIDPINNISNNNKNTLYSYIISTATSLKNETDFSPFFFSQVLCLVFEASFHSPLQLDETKLGGHLLTASGLHVEVKSLAS
jgi:hypothetical protein